MKEKLMYDMDWLLPKAPAYPPLDRKITAKEYSEALNMALDAGLKRIDGVTI